LEEYEKKLESERANLALPKPRAPNEGADESQWANASKLERDEETSIPAAKGKKHNPSGASKKKNFVPMTDVLRVQERKERPPRGRDRGDRGDRGRSQKKAAEVQINISDNVAFPALSEKHTA
jgi:hypothetical protein